jgi:hypothetical protein
MRSRPVGECSENFAVGTLGTGKGLTLTTHVGEILGQGDEIRAAFGRLDHALLSACEVALQVVVRADLNDRNAHVGRIQPRNWPGSTPVRRITS